MKKIKWTDEIVQFMIDNYQGKDNIELANLLNEKFNLDANADKISNVKTKLKKKGINLRTGINRGCIKKGNIPANKGKKWDDYLTKEQQDNCRKTTFKKGNIPHNHKKVGSERITVDGYIEIKVAEPNKWESKAKVIYEEKYGKIPKGSKIIYLDGNRLNLDINNLKLISNHENLIMNEFKLRYGRKELTECAYIIAQIEEKRRKIKNEK